MREFHKHSSHRCSMEVRTADVVHRKGSLAFRLLTVGDAQREEYSHTFQRWHIPLKSSDAEETSDFHGLLDPSHHQLRPVVWSITIILVSVNPTERHCFGSFRILTKNGLPNAHTGLPLVSLP